MKMRRRLRRGPNWVAVYSLADEIAQKISPDCKRTRRRAKATAVRCMIESAVYRMKKTEMRRFLQMWRGIFLEIIEERSKPKKTEAA